MSAGESVDLTAEMVEESMARLRKEVCPMCQSEGPFGQMHGMPTPENGMTSHTMSCEKCGYRDRAERFNPVLIEADVNALFYNQSIILDGQWLNTEASTIPVVPIEKVYPDRPGDLVKLLRIVADIVEERDGDIETALRHLAEQNAPALESLTTDLSLVAGYCQFLATLCYEAVADETWSAEMMSGQTKPFKVTPEGWNQATEDMNVILSSHGFDVFERAAYPTNLPFVQGDINAVPDTGGGALEAGSDGGEHGGHQGVS